MAGELTIRRTRFRIGTGEWASGHPVGLEIRGRHEVALRREERG